MGGRIHGGTQNPAFIADLGKSTGRSLRLHFTQRGQFDARPVSLISLSAAATLSEVLDFLRMFEYGNFYVLG
jgi:hypothetical protein